MGTDIHAGIEYRDAAGWHAYLSANKYYGRYENEPMLSARVSIDRDYDLFAILANVRNGTAFAGCVTGEGFVPLSDNRGLPEDISLEALNTACTGEHSATWVSLKEILDYDWSRTTNKFGVVSAKEFEEWDRTKEWRPAPAKYCGDIVGPGVRHISESQMRDYVHSVVGGKTQKAYTVAIEELDKNTYARVSWNETYAKAGEQIWTAVLPVMLQLGVEHGLDNVRLVMNFDS